MPASAAATVTALLAMSRAAGTHEDWVLHGGGNSSAKGWTTDRWGRPLRTLWVKGSGSDMRTLEQRHLTPLDLEALLRLRHLEALDDEAMVAELGRSMLSAKAPRGSIETLLHAYLPADYVLHTHADATAALMDTPRAAWHVGRCFGGTVGLLPYQRPGFSLSVAAAKLHDRGQAPGRPWRALLLDKHGLITWGASGRQALRETELLLEQARRYVKAGRRAPAPLSPPRNLPEAKVWLPLLRGALSRWERQLLCWDRSA